MNLLRCTKPNIAPNLVTIGVIAAILASIAEALYTPLAKLISADAGVMMSISFIFFGAGCGSLIILFFGRKSKALFDPNRHLRKKDSGVLLGVILISMVVFTAEIIGLQQESATTASILQNIETVAVVIFAALILKEKISKRLGIGVALIVLGSVALVVTNPSSLSISTGSLIIIGGCTLCGVLYILMKLLSERNPIEITIIRGFIIGVIALILALCMGESLPSVPHALGIMATGCFSGSLAPLFLMYAQRHLGAAKAGAIYGIYPLLGVVLAIPIFGEMPSAAFLAALILFIPGMYFVIMKSSNATAVMEKKADDSEEEDVQFFTSIKESRKREMRNRVTSFGLLVVALFFVLMTMNVFDTSAANAPAEMFSTYVTGAIFGTIILFCGVSLLILGKRVMAAVTFILIVPQMIVTTILGGELAPHVLSGIFAIIFALILMTSKDPQKYAFAIVNLLFGVSSILCIFDNPFCGFITIAAAVYLIWLSLASGTGKLRFSISKYLTEDGEMTFGRCGSVIGYLLIALILMITIIYEHGDPSVFFYTEKLLSFGLIVAVLLILVGLMLMFIGKRKLTPIIFIGFGIVLPLDILLSGVFQYLPVILLLVLGIQNVMRRDPHILPSILLIGNGFALMLSNQLTTYPEIQTALLLITVGCVAVALYLSFAVFAEKPKLPLF